MSAEQQVTNYHNAEDSEIAKLSLEEKQKQISNEKINDWNYHWDLASNSINHSSAKNYITVVSPEVVSSIMSKSVSQSVI
jgi:hypothetical protein